jgi:hypothetical protein
MNGKDKTGKYHPPKGKPSGSPKKGNEHLTPAEIRDESSVSENALEYTRIRHVNRDVRKPARTKGHNPDEQ